MKTTITILLFFNRFAFLHKGSKLTKYGKNNRKKIAFAAIAV
jgi:hypothetical protein